MTPTVVGDLQNNLKKLEKVLRDVRYRKEVDFVGLARGTASAYLPIYDYLFTSYHKDFTELLCSLGIELSGKVDEALMKAIYKVLRDVFAYKPPVTVEQFFNDGFVERKAIMTVEVIRAICKRYMPPRAVVEAAHANKNKILRATNNSGATASAAALPPSSAGVVPDRPMITKLLVAKPHPASTGVTTSSLVHERQEQKTSGSTTQRRVSLPSSMMLEHSDLPAVNVSVHRESVPNRYVPVFTESNIAARADFGDSLPSDPETSHVDCVDGRFCHLHCSSVEATVAAPPSAVPDSILAINKSVDALIQKMKDMDRRLEGLASVVAGAMSSIQPPVPSITSTDMENLTARVVILESRVLTLFDLVEKDLAHKRTAFVPDQEEPAVTTPLGKTNDKTGELCLPSLGSVACCDTTPFPCAINGDSPAGEDPVTANHFDCSADLSSPSGGSSTSGSHAASPDVITYVSSEACYLTTPDKTKVHNIAQMLEGTMKMLKSK